ncbi:MAG: PAS domain-containing protein [Candidatus Tyrphobacter sp.]
MSPAGIVIVDRRYDIIHINRSARTLLNVSGIGIGEDLLHTATSVDTTALRTLIDRALRNDADVCGVLALRLAAEEDRYVKALAYGERSSVSSMQVDAVALIVVDVTEMVRDKDEFERHAARHSAELATLRSRTEELAQRQRLLLESNDELATANLGLKGANDQLVISLEEAASSAEEIETLNEELQATNEELETLNEELQATVEELNTTNEELEARGRNLEARTEEDRARLRATQRMSAGLKAALEALDEPIALLAEDGAAIFTNDALGRLLPGLTFELEGRVMSMAELPMLAQSQVAAVFARAAAGAKSRFRVRAHRLTTGDEKLFMLVLSPSVA